MRAAVAFSARRRKAPCDDNVRFLKTAVLMRSFELPYLFGAGAAACLRQDAFAAKRLPVQGSAVSRKRTLIEASFPKRRTSRRPISHGGILSLWLTRRAVRRDFARRTDDGSPLFRSLFALPYESRRERQKNPLSKRVFHFSRRDPLPVADASRRPTGLRPPNSNICYCNALFCSL